MELIRFVWLFGFRTCNTYRYTSIIKSIKDLIRSCITFNPHLKKTDYIFYAFQFSTMTEKNIYTNRSQENNSSKIEHAQSVYSLRNYLYITLQWKCVFDVCMLPFLRCYGNYMLYFFCVRTCRHKLYGSHVVFFLRAFHSMHMCLHPIRFFTYAFF